MSEAIDVSAFRQQASERIEELVDAILSGMELTDEAVYAGWHPPESRSNPFWQPATLFGDLMRGAGFQDDSLRMNTHGPGWTYYSPSGGPRGLGNIRPSVETPALGEYDLAVHALRAASYALRRFDDEARRQRVTDIWDASELA